MHPSGDLHAQLAQPASPLLGLALCRYALVIPPVAAMTIDELVRHVAPTVQRYALGDK